MAYPRITRAFYPLNDNPGLMPETAAPPHGARPQHVDPDAALFDTYMRMPESRPATRSASPTPSPTDDARMHMAALARPAQPQLVLLNSPVLPVCNLDMFLALQPRTMPPYTATATYTTENASLRFFAFAEADGATMIQTVGNVGRMQDIQWQMQQDSALAQGPMPPPWHLPTAPPAFVPPPCEVHPPQPMPPSGWQASRDKPASKPRKRRAKKQAEL